MRVALIGGTIFLQSVVFEGAEPMELLSDFGRTTLFIKDEAVFIPRHGIHKNIPPHMINHQSNMKALKDLGVLWVFSANSVGSLKNSLSPGALLLPDDYIDLWNDGTFYSNSLVHITPSLDEEMRGHIIKAAKNLGISLIDSGVYVQTKGPRLETKAEIRFLQNFADVVGMTMGSEATAAREIGLKYASLSSVDNYANGIVKTPLLDKDIKEASIRNTEIIKMIFFEVLKIIDSTPGR